MSCFICPHDSRKRSRACQGKESHALWTHLEVMSCQALEKKSSPRDEIAGLPFPLAFKSLLCVYVCQLIFDTLDKSVP